MYHNLFLLLFFLYTYLHRHIHTSQRGLFLSFCVYVSRHHLCVSTIRRVYRNFMNEIVIFRVLFSVTLCCFCTFSNNNNSNTYILMPDTCYVCFVTFWRDVCVCLGWCVVCTFVHIKRLRRYLYSINTVGATFILSLKVKVHHLSVWFEQK